MGLYTNSQLIHNTVISVRKQPVSDIRPGGAELPSECPSSTPIVASGIHCE